MKALLKKIINRNLALKARELQRQIKTIPYRLGSAVECPTCGGKFRSFMPFRYRTNAQCPNCKSLERHRYIYLQLRDNLKIFDTPKKRVLHFAPDICLLPYLQNNPNIDYVTADYMTSFTSSITVKPDHVMSIDDIQFPDESFDVIIAIGILVMVSDDSKAMREVFRCLKTGGYALFHDPIDLSRPKSFSDAGLSKAEKQKLHHGHDQRWYYGADYADRLRAQGFVVEDDTFVTQIDTKRFGISQNEKIYIGKKQ